MRRLSRSLAEKFKICLEPVGFSKEDTIDDYVWFFREQGDVSQVVDVMLDESARDKFIKCRLWGRSSSNSLQAFLDQLDYPWQFGEPLWKNKTHRGGLGHIVLDCSRHGAKSALAPWVLLDPRAQTSGGTVPSRVFTDEDSLVADLLAQLDGVLQWHESVQTKRALLEQLHLRASKYPGLTPERELLSLAVAWNGEPSEIQNQLSILARIMADLEEANIRNRGRSKMDIAMTQYVMRVLEQRRADANRLQGR